MAIRVNIYSVVKTKTTILISDKEIEELAISKFNDLCEGDDEILIIEISEATND